MGVDGGRAGRFEELFNANHGRVLAYCLRRMHSADAHEIAGDVWLVAWRRFEEIPSEPLPWLLGVARKTIANKRRSQKRASATVEKMAREPQWVSEPPTGSSGELLTALSRLSPNDTEVLMLFAWDGLPPREAARVLGCSPATFSVRLHRARRRLLKELDAFGHNTIKSIPPAPGEEKI